MVDKSNPTPPPGSPGGPQPTPHTQGPKGNPIFQTWHPKPLKWLGMQFDEKETKQLWNIISQSVSREIEKEKDKAIKAIKKMNPDNQDKDDDY